MLAVDDPSATYKLLRKEFERRGYAFEEFHIQDKHYVRFTSPDNKSWLTRAERISYPMNDAVVDAIATYKSLSYDFARRFGMNVPETIAVKKNESPDVEAIEHLLQTHASVIVKPEDSSLSKGLTINLRDVSAVIKAIQYAHSYSDAALIQQQVKGEEIRFVVLDGVIRSAILRETAGVMGDGSLTMDELIKKENSLRENLSFEYVGYPQLTANIITKQYDPTYIVPKGERVSLASSTMIKGGASIYDVLTEVHNSYLEIVTHFAQSIGAGFIVIDMFIEDYKTALTDTNAYLIEINKAPVVKLFYGTRDGRVFDAVPMIVDAIHNHLHKA